MIKGIDISHWNLPNRVKYSDYDFVIIKASEGVTWTDPLKWTHATNVNEEKQGLGFYHYARPENGNRPEDEAMNFLREVAPYKGRAMLALDWEGAALKCPIIWAREWMDFVYKQTGTRPVFYCQYSYSDKIDIIREGNYGIWLARYNNSISDKDVVCKDKKRPAMWQYTSTPIDQDKFFGTLKQFRKYY